MNATSHQYIAMFIRMAIKGGAIFDKIDFVIIHNHIKQPCYGQLNTKLS